MDIRRQTAQELQGETSVPDGPTSGGGPGSRHSAADRIVAINHRIGRSSVPSSGSAAADSLAALAARNDMAVGGQAGVLSVRSSNIPAVSFMHTSHLPPSGNIPASTSNEAAQNILPISSGPSSLVGTCGNTGILDTSGGVVEPLDYEEYVMQQQRAYGNVSGRTNPSGAPRGGTTADGGGAADDRLHLIDFPADDIEVNVVARKIRTVEHVVPEEPL